MTDVRDLLEVRADDDRPGSVSRAGSWTRAEHAVGSAYGARRTPDPAFRCAPVGAPPTVVAKSSSRALRFALLGLLAALVPLAPAGATPQDENPLAGHRWGVYKGSAEMAWAPYEKATGHRKKLLSRIALRPKAKWFGAWIADRDIKRKVHEYVQNATGGDDDVLVQLTLFRLVPWEQETCQRLPTRAEKESYRRWMRRFTTALGDTRAAVVLQPDGPFALCAPGGSRVHSRLLAWTARRLDALPRTTAYLDVGSSGWNHEDPANAVKLLVRGGIEHLRGFHLNTTHYMSVASQVRFGARVVDALEQRGIVGRHFTVDTAENGRPFTWEWHEEHRPDVFFNNAPTCGTRGQTHCVTLGIPPTTGVGARRWGLSRGVRRLAREHVDAYLWAGRPWLRNQTAPFSMRRALRMARTTPYR